MSDDFPIVVIGASAGGVEVLGTLVKNLPPDLNAAVMIVMHMPTTARSVLPQILTRVQTIPATYPVDGQRMQPGRIYIAPPDWHMVLRDAQHISLTKGPRENGFRPAIDPLFRSAAVCAGARAIGVILSGALDDGTAGLLAIKRAGGLALVQDPKETIFTGMPTSAIQNVPVDYILPVASIGTMVGELSRLDLKKGQLPPYKSDKLETYINDLNASPDATKLLGRVSGFGCPECGGTLWEMEDEPVDLRFRCRVGHAYSAESLLGQQTDALERALWTAIRALRERADLSRRLAERMDNNHHHSLARRHKLASSTASSEAELLVSLLRDGGLLRQEEHVPEELEEAAEHTEEPVTPPDNVEHTSAEEKPSAGSAEPQK